MERSTKENAVRQTRRRSIYNNEASRQRPIISFEDVTKKYQNGVEALRNLSFRIEEGEFVFLMGSSGAGKSTLIKLILLEERPTSGRIYVKSRNVAQIKRAQIQTYRRSIGVFFQDFRLLEKKTVFQNVAFAMEITGASRKEIEEKVNITLSLMGLSAKKKEYPSHLSGGEQQRVALARAIVNGPDILIADEPTGNLDPENSGEIMELLMKINSYGTTVLVATHEQGMAEESGKRIVRLDHGRTVEEEVPRQEAPVPGNDAEATPIAEPEPAPPVDIARKVELRKEDREMPPAPIEVPIESVRVEQPAESKAEENPGEGGENA